MLEWPEIEVALDHIREMLHGVSKNATECAAQQRALAIHGHGAERDDMICAVPLFYLVSWCVPQRVAVQCNAICQSVVSARHSAQHGLLRVHLCGNPDLREAVPTPRHRGTPPPWTTRATS